MPTNSNSAFLPRRFGAAARTRFVGLSLFAILALTLAGDVLAGQSTDDHQQRAWNRTDRYQSPDYENYFVEDDPAAVKRLDEFLGSSTLRQESPQEFIDVVRRGLRSTPGHKTIVLSWVGNTFIWNKSPQNPDAIELMYHACAAPNADVVHYAMYFGTTVVSERSYNLVRMLMERFPSMSPDTQRRIHWGFKTYGDQDIVAKYLLRLLDERDNLNEDTVVATYRAYQQLTGNPPPDAERFSSTGLVAWAFAHPDDSTEQALRERVTSKLEAASSLVDFVARQDGQRLVGVALLRGLPHLDRVLHNAEQDPRLEIVFNAPLNDQSLQTKRLREFSRHLPGGLPAFAAPEYSNPQHEAPLAWNRTDRFEPPDFESFFPDDEAAGKRLDELFEQRSEVNLSDRELLEAFQQGLRHSQVRQNQLFGWLSGALGWPSHPYQTEIFYQACGPAAPQETRYNAVYFGLGNWWDKSDNVLRLFAQILTTEPFDRHLGHNMRGRILWSVRNTPREKEFLAERLAESLARHKELDFITIVQLDEAYRQLADAPPPMRADYEDRGAVVILFRQSAADTEAELKAYADKTLASSPYWLAFATTVNKNEVSGMALVKGLAGKEWLIKKLQQEPGNAIDYGVPFTRQSIGDTPLTTVPEFQPFLEPDKKP